MSEWYLVTFMRAVPGSPVISWQVQTSKGNALSDGIELFDHYMNAYGPQANDTLRYMNLVKYKLIENGAGGVARIMIKDYVSPMKPIRTLNEL